MQNVGAAWRMVSLHAGPGYVALIQTAAALPNFLLAPAGSAGDIFDRRRLILYSEVWMMAVALILAVLTIRGTRKHNSTRPHAKRSRTRAQVKYLGPRISRPRLRSVREDLDNTRSLMSDTVDKFWIKSEHSIRDTLAKTEQKIG